MSLCRLQPASSLFVEVIGVDLGFQGSLGGVSGCMASRVPRASGVEGLGSRPDDSRTAVDAGFGWQLLYT